MKKPTEMTIGDLIAMIEGEFGSGISDPKVLKTPLRIAQVEQYDVGRVRRDEKGRLIIHATRRTR